MADYTARFRVDDDYYVQATPRTGSGSAQSNAKLFKLISAACAAHLVEPNLALDFEVADYINSKKGTSARDAAQAIVKLINHQSRNVSIMALSLLDICVKNCGYPFHLQISRKEFLNELVKKFPEKPPVNYTHTQCLILEVLQDWRETLCKHSRYKDDLGYIRDMHRLLTYKGYHFPEVNRDDAAVLREAESLKSAAELEAEEQDAHSAKLQELIRSGSPRDLQEANHLMKIMAGFKESKTNYAAKAAEDLEKVKTKAHLLDEMMAAHPSGTPFKADDVYAEMYSAVKAAHPRIQKMTEEEGQDEETVAKLLQLNDYLHSLVDKFELLRKGDFDGAGAVSAKAPSGAPTTKPVVSDLIDFGDDLGDQPAASSGGATGAASSAGASTVDDLLGDLDGLSFNNNSGFGQGGSISLLGATNNASSAAPTISKHSGTPAGSGNLFDLDFSPSASPAPAATPAPAFNFSSLSQLTANKGGETHAVKTAPSEDPSEAWNFVGASSGAAKAREVPILQTGDIKVTGLVSRAGNGVEMTLQFSNKSFTENITALDFKIAAPKSVTLKLDPASSDTLGAASINGVTQEAHVGNAGDKLKLRFKLNFNVGARAVEEVGTVEDL